MPMLRGLTFARNGFIVGRTKPNFLQNLQEQEPRSLQGLKKEAEKTATKELINNYQSALRAQYDYNKSLVDKYADLARQKEIIKANEKLNQNIITPKQYQQTVKTISSMPPDMLDIENCMGDVEAKHFIMLARRSQDALWQLWDAMRQVFIDAGYDVKKAPKDLIIFLNEHYPQSYGGHADCMPCDQKQDSLNVAANMFIYDFVKNLFENVRQERSEKPASGIARNAKDKIENLKEVAIEKAIPLLAAFRKAEEEERKEWETTLATARKQSLDKLEKQYAQSSLTPARYEELKKEIQEARAGGPYGPLQEFIDFRKAVKLRDDMHQAYSAIYEAIEQVFREKGYETTNLIANDANINGLNFEKLSKNDQQEVMNAQNRNSLFRENAYYIIESLTRHLVGEKSYLHLINADK